MSNPPQYNLPPQRPGNYAQNIQYSNNGQQQQIYLNQQQQMHPQMQFNPQFINYQSTPQMMYQQPMMNPMMYQQQPMMQPMMQQVQQPMLYQPPIQQPLQLQPTAQHPIIDLKFCVQQPTTLILKENIYSASNDDFDIMDLSNRPWFKLDAKLFSMKEKRTLLDINRSPILTMTKRLFTIGSKWNVHRGSSSKKELLYTVENKVMTFTPHINIYLNDGDRNPDFVVTGNFGRKDFEIFDARKSSRVLIGSVSKQRPFESFTALISNRMGADCYYLNINQGHDAAFFVTICLLLEEFYSEQD